VAGCGAMYGACRAWCLSEWLTNSLCALLGLTQMNDWSMRMLPPKLWR
jgi:hypothetical protein